MIPFTVLWRFKEDEIFNQGYEPDTPGVTCTIAELRELCKEWQRILRLQDWDIHLSIERKAGMHDTDVEAQVRCTQAIKYANIKILDPIDTDNGHRIESDKYQSDMEHALVHEMLHIKFDKALDGAKRTDKVAFEQAIDQTALALIRLKRGR